MILVLLSDCDDDFLPFLGTSIIIIITKAKTIIIEPNINFFLISKDSSSSNVFMIPSSSFFDKSLINSSSSIIIR